MYRILKVLSGDEVRKCRDIAAAATFADGRITNPHNKAKQNEQLHDQRPYQESAALLAQALGRSIELAEFAFPALIAPPLITRYRPGMQYGAHADASFITLPSGRLRSDISCTIFLSPPESYTGGALHVRLGDGAMRFKLPPGQAIFYPSDTLHEVEPVTGGERLVGITFIQSEIADPLERYMLFELNEVAALEGNNMSHESFSRLQLVQSNLRRRWSDRP